MLNESTLKIAGVDLNLLDEQRRHLSALCERLVGVRGIPEAELLALEGLSNMLECWADERGAS